MTGQPGQFAYEGLDRVMHERARLGILSCMAGAEVDLTFRDLKELCDLTDGNLSRHLHALEDSGIVEIRKQSPAPEHGKRSQTLVSFTEAGKERFLDYVDLLESIARDSVKKLRQPRRRRVVPLPEGGVS